MTPTTAPPPAVVLGRYALGEELPPGPDGPAFAGRDRRTGRPVVLTVLPDLAADPDRHHRAARAFRAAARLDHPAVLRTLDFGLDGADGYAVTEPAGGDPLGRVVADRGRLPEAAAARVAADLADALDYAHAGGVLHDGLTPDRVFVRPDGGARLGGWGFAAAAGRRGATPAEDVADLGEAVYFALTGRGWPDGFDPADDGVYAHIRRAVDPDPARRPATAGALARLLAAPDGDRRASDRHPVTPGLLGVADDGPLGRWPVIVQDVSAGGVGLLIGRRFEPGAELRVGFGGGADPVPARVVRVGAKAFGHWFHGCAFAAPLPAAALGELLRQADRAVVLT